MARTNSQSQWAPIDAASHWDVARALFGALAFNLCLLALPIAGASAFFLIQTEGLYSYPREGAALADVRDAVEREAGDLILLDFDRTRQWNEIVALELSQGDTAVARGFVLSAPHMLPRRDGQALRQEVGQNASDAEMELAALNILTPSTRGRYEASMPLLSESEPVAPPALAEDALGDAGEFERLSAAVLADQNVDPLHFTLLGLSLGMGPEISTSAKIGAVILVAASRRGDFPDEVNEDFTRMARAALPLDAFRSAAFARADASEDAQAADYAIASQAFSDSLGQARLAPLLRALENIGDMTHYISASSAALLLTHARDADDMPRLLQVTAAAGDRAVAVAKHASPDGSLASAAQSHLQLTSGLIVALGCAFAATIGVIGLAGVAARASVRGGVRNLLRRFKRRGLELVHDFNSPHRAI